MRYINHLLLALTLLTGCSTEDPNAEPRISVSTDIAVAGTAGSKAQFRIQAPHAWSIVVDDTRYTIEPMQGEAGEHTLTLTTREDNPQKQSRHLDPFRVISASGTSTVEIIQRPGVVAQALFIFFIGTNLQGFFDNNLADAMSSMTPSVPGEGRVASFCHKDGTWCIVELAYNAATGKGSLTTLKQYDRSLNRNTPAFLTQVISDLKALVPAHEYGIVFGGHGTGWLPKGYSIYGSTLYGLQSAAAQAAELNATTGTGPDGKPYPITRYFGETGSVFDIAEIAAGIEASQTLFHYIIFDDCFMSNIETLYTLRNSAEYIIASPCEIMGNGFPYHYVIPNLFSENGTKSNLQGVCEKFYHYYLNEYNTYFRSGCIAMTVCGELNALAATAKRLFTSGTGEVNASKLQVYEGLTKHLFYDFRQYVEQIARDDVALAAFHEQFDRTFPAACRLHTPSFYSWYYQASLIPINYYSGVTCSAPSTSYPTENHATDWWKATH